MNARKLSVLAQIGFVIVCAGGFYLYTRNQTKPVQVLVFNKTLPANTPITSGDLSKITVPESVTKTKDFVKDTKDLEGKVVSAKVFPNDYVTTDKVVANNEKDPFESMNLSNYRKISLPIDYVSGLGGALKKGDKVDLIYVSEQSTTIKGNQTKVDYAKTFMQDVPIYSLTTDDGYLFNDKTGGTKGSTAGSSEKDKTNVSTGDSGKLSTITLAVTADQANEISARLKSGEIRVVGRFSKSTNQDTQGFKIVPNGSGVTATQSNVETK